MNVNKAKHIRQSNFELLRIVSMLMIVFYHAFYHLKIGNVTASETQFSFNLVVGYLLGSWGLVGVGCFFLISAYFLIGHSQSFNVKKLLRLILQVIFWMLILLAVSNIFNISPNESNVKKFLKVVLSPFIGVYWFITAYIFMYLLYPFINNFILNFKNKLATGLK